MGKGGIFWRRRQAKRNISIWKRGGRQRGSEAVEDLSYVGGDTIVLFFMPARDGDRGGSILWRRRIWTQKEKLVQTVRNQNKERMNNKMKLTPPVHTYGNTVHPLCLLDLSAPC